jgi:taurine dioxygenase
MSSLGPRWSIIVHKDIADRLQSHEYLCACSGTLVAHSPVMHSETLPKAGLRVTTLAPGFVARVEGVDITRLDDATFAALYDQFIATPVLVLPGQPADAAAFFAASERFGEVVEHVLRQFHHPEVWGVCYVNNLDTEGRIDPKGVNRSTGWHTDRCYDPRMGKTTALLGVEVPSRGGDTLFADLYAACTALPADLRTALAGKIGQFRWHGRPADHAVALTAAQQEEAPGGDHPILSVHPESGRPTLYVAPGNMTGIIGMDRDESEPLLQRLFRHCLEERFHHAHRWTPGDLVIWDNRCTMHRAGGGYPPGERRVLMRTQTIARR